MSEKIENDSEQNKRKSFLETQKRNGPKQRRDIFEDYKVVNSYEIELSKTQNKLVLSLHQKKTDNTDYLFKWQIGKSSMFVDGKITFVVAEAMRYLTSEVVPDSLKPKNDSKPAEVKT